MPSLYSATESAPPINGSCRSVIDKPPFSSSLFPSSPTYPLHGGVAGAGPSDANVNGSVYFNTTKLTDRRMHNALQPISRLNSDVLEHLFLTGAFLVASHDASSHRHSSSPLSLSSKSTSLTRTILTYAQLTSSLRQIALRSARLWALLVDFERASFEWNAELLRRSAGVGLQVVWQWSKAAGAGAESGMGARSRSGSGRGRVDQQEWDWESNDRGMARQRKRREDSAKRARLDKVLHRSVLERASSLGFAVPAPYFTSVLLERLGSPDEVLPELESLRIVKSRPRRASISRLDVLDEDEEDDNHSGKELYVSLGVIANAPRLRRLAIAECNLSFHQLLPSSSSLSSSSQSVPDFSALSDSLPPTLYPSLNALYTLRRLQALQIADLPLRTAPTAREWLRYLTFMPALEELVLEGAVLRRMDLILRDEIKAGSEDGSSVSDGESGTGSADRSPHEERQRIGEGGRDTKGVDEETIDRSTLPKLNVVTLDAALEDVAVFATNLPLPSRTSRGRHMKWTLLCANADTGDLNDVEKVLDLFASAVSGDASVGSCAGRALSSPTQSFPRLCLSVRATESDVYVHLSATTYLPMDASPSAHVGGIDSKKSITDPEAGFSIYVNLHSIGGGVESSPLTPNRMTVEGTTHSATAPPSTTLLPPVLATLAYNVLPQVASLDLDLARASPGYSAGLTEVLHQARAVEVLTLGTEDARKVLRMLHAEHKHSFSLDSQLSSSSPESGSSSAGGPVEESTERVLLPSMRTLCLDEECATGPTWTALLRFVKARMANGVPVQRIEFNNRDTEQPHTQQFVRRSAGVLEGRIKELEGMGVKIAANGR